MGNGTKDVYLIVVAIIFYYHIKSMCITYMYLTEHFVDWPYLRTNLNMISILLFKKIKSEHVNLRYQSGNQKL